MVILCLVCRNGQILNCLFSAYTCIFIYKNPTKLDGSVTIFKDLVFKMFEVTMCICRAYISTPIHVQNVWLELL